MNTNALWQAAFGVIFAGQAMDGWQIVAMVLGLCGVFSIGYFDNLMTKIDNNNKLGNLRRSITLEMA